MSSELIQEVLNIIFSKHMIYLAPMIFLFMAILFTDRIIEIIQNALADRNRWR
ncbi:hypothetical protein J27TS8_27500 [Robertmurraya siralis]|uniref:Uncharacterized protein n=1 Tax=Robertmurraya siralis TaxID=77777 RepID=A0A919WJC5_9BACI|nr:hypothetical protein J27TS8_27500 [Robertmurraya siralis]